MSLQALSLQEYIPDVAVLYSVDWLLGMFRTATNIWGDACACVVVDTWARRHAKKHGTLPIRVSLESMKFLVIICLCCDFKN